MTRGHIQRGFLQSRCALFDLTQTLLYARKDQFWNAYNKERGHMLKKIAQALKGKTKRKKYVHHDLPDDPKELAKAMFWENDEKAKASRKRNQD